MSPFTMQSLFLNQMQNPIGVKNQILNAAHNMEPYGIAGYSAAHAHALRFGQKDVVTLLEQTLAAKRQTNQTRTRFATASLNPPAANEPDVEDEDEEDEDEDDELDDELDTDQDQDDDEEEDEQDKAEEG